MPPSYRYRSVQCREDPHCREFAEPLFPEWGRLYVILRSQGAGEGLDQSELREISRCQNVKILCVKRTVANAHANLPRRRHPRAIGRNGMYKRKRRPGLVA